MKKVLYGIATFALIAVFLFMALGSSSNTDESSSDSKSSAQSSQQSAQSSQQSEQSSEKSSNEENNVYKAGDTLDADGLKITMQKAENYTSNNEFMQPNNGNKFIRAYFVIENQSNTDKTVGASDFNCYADGTSCENKFFSEKEELTVIDTISKGRNAKGYVYYEVPANAKDIEIEYETSWWTSKKAIFKVEL